MKPVCVPCQRFMRPDRNGVAFIEGMPRGGTRPKPGLAEPGAWKPYKLWYGDRWKCPDCGATIIVGVPTSPVAEHYQPEFAEAVKRHDATLQINDC